MRILFMGTPEFAVASLRRLVADGHEICGVFTQPDKPRNRGMKLTFSPVKEFALTKGLPVYQPVRMRHAMTIDLVRELEPELIVVAAYGKILPEEMLKIPPRGCINVHSSLLPKYRGAAPINWAILNGETETGVTIMFMSKELDAGDILHVEKAEIAPHEDAAVLTARLAELGAKALSETLRLMREGKLSPTAQDHANSTYAPMLSKELSPIDWTKSAHAIDCQVRGLLPWPCASAILGGKAMKIFETAEGRATDAAAGTVIAAGKHGIEVACGDGKTLFITQLQAEGGKRMAAADYLCGHPIQIAHE